MKLKIEMSKNGKYYFVKYKWEKDYHSIDTPNECQQISDTISDVFGLEKTSINNTKNVLYNIGSKEPKVLEIEIKCVSE